MIKTQVTEKTVKFQLASEGAHLATVGLLADLGKQETVFKDVKSIKEQLFIRFILLNEFLEDKSDNLSLMDIMTNSLDSRSKFFKLVSATDSLIGGKLDLNKLLTTPFVVEVEHYKRKDGELGGKVKNISKVMKGTVLPSSNIIAKVYDLDKPDQVVFESLPTWVQEKIVNRKGLEVKVEAKVNKIAESLNDKSVPF